MSNSKKKAIKPFALCDLEDKTITPNDASETSNNSVEVTTSTETKPEEVKQNQETIKVSKIYKKAIEKPAIEEAKIIAEAGVPTNANAVAELADKLNQVRANSKPAVVNFTQKEKVIKVNYFITQTQKDKVRKMAAALGLKPSHVIAQMIDSIVPSYIDKKLSNGGK